MCSEYVEHGCLFGRERGEAVAMNHLLGAALTYRKQNFSVIPIRANDKVSLVEWAPFQKELASEEQIRQWWEQYPDANVGIGEGLGSDFHDSTIFTSSSDLNS